MNFMGVGNLELLVIIVLALLILGPRQLVMLTQAFGKFIGNIREITENLPRYAEEFLEEDEESTDQSPAIPPPPDAQPRKKGAGNEKN